MRTALTRRACAVAAAAVTALAAGCELFDSTGPADSETCQPSIPGATTGIALEPQAVRMTLADLASRVAPSFGMEGSALAGRMNALAASWPAPQGAACDAYNEARAVLARIPVVPETSPDRAYVAFVLDVVGSMLVAD